MQAESLSRGRKHADALAVIDYCECDITPRAAQTDTDASRLAVLERVVDGFLRHAEQVPSQRGIIHQHRLAAVKPAAHAEQLGGLVGKFTQGDHQSLRLGPDGGKAA